MTRRILVSLYIVATLGMLVHPARAVGATLEFTPVVAHLVPLNSQVVDSDGPIVIRQPSATAYGARVAWWAAPRVGIEAGMLIGSSSIEIIGGDVLSLNAYLFQFEARARIRLNDPAADTGLDFIGGIGFTDLGDGLTDFGEDAGLKSPAQFTGVVGLGATVPVTDRVRLRFDVEDHIHNSNLEADEAILGNSFDNRTQHDLVFTMGLVVPVW